MKNTNTDVMIMTRIILSQDQFDEVARQVKTLDGVIKFDQNPQKPRLIMVAFNAGKTRAINILNKITRLGFNASLVGI